MALFKAALLLLAVPHVFAEDTIFNGFGSTGLYWDCCKPSCAWPEKGPWLTHPVNTCAKDSSPLTDAMTGSACGKGGTAYVCNDQQPWAVNETFSYGFVSAFIVGATEYEWCCSCYELEFTNGGVEGKKMIVQATNTGYDDPTRNIFGIGAPGEYDYAGACLNRYDGAAQELLGKTPENKRVLTRDECEDLPEPMRRGCFWRFDWFNDAFKPNMTFKRTKCPKVLTDVTDCVRSDEDTFVNATSAASMVSPSGSITGSLMTISTMISILFFAFNL